MLAAAFMLATATASGTPVTASSICVYNKAAFVLKWHERAAETNAVSQETRAYPVGQVKCQSLAALGNISVGTAVYPVVKAVWGKEIQAARPVLYDPINAVQITYVCKGTTLNFHCDQGPMPPTAANVTKAIGEFLLGFVDGLGTEIGFMECLTDVNKTFHDIATIVQKLEEGFKQKEVAAIVQAFELMGGMLKDFSAAISVCVKEAEDFVAKVKDLAAALQGDVLSVLKIVVEEAIHIFRERKELSADAKAVTADWRAGDFQGSGKAVGDIVGIIVDGL
eukprot:Hpha_TRINITY_DN15540_c1_g9::TRINITY_DN15540_c1_g9_i1::g.104298::m.104298